MKNIEKALSAVRAAGIEVYENEKLSGHSSFKIGGEVRAFVLPADMEEMKVLCRILQENEIVPMVLGNGTNILFPDEGLRNVLMICTEKLCAMEIGEDGKLYAEAGISLSKLSVFARQNSLAGLEFASGIPGTLGGGALMNAGAYGGELKDVIESVTCLTFPDLELVTLKNEDCAFRYRGSAFKEMRCVIVSAVLKLEKGDSEEIAGKMRALGEKRREKQPLDLPSAGSAFKRPEGYYAAALIDECGLKGYRVGGAQVSEKHAGFVVNIGGATAKDVRTLMEDVQRIVFEKKGVNLEPEIIMLGEDYMP